MNKERKYDLESRFVAFSLMIMKIVERLPKSYVGQHFAKQLIRSGTSPSFQYGEAQAAESRKDFIHKLKIGLKELKETKVCLTLIKKHPLLVDQIVELAINECDQLIAITFQSISTAQINRRN